MLSCSASQWPDVSSLAVDTMMAVPGAATRPRSWAEEPGLPPPGHPDDRDRGLIGKGKSQITMDQVSIGWLRLTQLPMPM